ncbi:MAG: diguanylate cyclase [Oleiphilaceae bacterium]|nr:diguanylate cyclase [Oleiphilaceae bacterium]
MLQSLSLRHRFTLLIFILVLGVTLLLGTIVSIESSNLVRRNIGASAASAAFQLADKLDRQMAAHVQEVQLLRQVLSLSLGAGPDAVRSQLERLQQSYDVVSWIGFVRPDGTVMAATGGILEGISIAHRPIFQNGQEALWLGDVHEAKMLARLLPNPSGEPIKFVDIAAPVREPDGTLRGVLAVHLSWEWAQQVMTSMFPDLQSQLEAELFVVAQDGAVLLGPEAMIGQVISPLEFRPRVGERARGWTVRPWEEGSEYLTGYAATDGQGDFDGLGWTVLSRKPVSAAFAPVRSLQLRIALVGFTLALIFAITGWAITSRLHQPLLRLASAADRVRSGQQSDTIPLQPSSPELYQLSLSMRQMVARLQEQRQTIGNLETQVHNDSLTGLPNRAFMEQYLKHAMAEVQREKRVLALIFMDLDGFKGVNDSLGHQAGDQVLQSVADRLREHLRTGDIAVRLGGDEFVLILKTERDKAFWLMKQMASRLLPAISTPMALTGGQTAKVGISLGAAWWPDHGSTIETVKEHADQSLYQAKASGRNRLVIYQSESPPDPNRRP